MSCFFSVFLFPNTFLLCLFFIFVRNFNFSIVVCRKFYSKSSVRWYRCIFWVPLSICWSSFYFFCFVVYFVICYILFICDIFNDNFIVWWLVAIVKIIRYCLFCGYFKINEGVFLTNFVKLVSVKLLSIIFVWVSISRGVWTWGGT